MSEILQASAQVALVVMIVLMLPTTYRVWIGTTPADRLQAVDTLTTLLIGIIVVLGIVQGSVLLIDIGIALAAFSFVGAIAIARYLSEGKVF
jgi:multisubunit Na+/H+ antiporter MnhF subunit